MVNVSVVLVKAIVGDGEFAVRGQSSTITIGKVVYDNLDKVLGAGGFTFSACISKVCSEGGSLRNDVEPGEGGNRGDLQGFGLLGGVGDEGSSGSNFGCIVGSEVDLKTFIQF